MRVSKEPAYVLHARDYGETSLLVELFTPNYGRVGAIAKGARKTRSRYGGTISMFQDFLVSWSGRTDLVTLTNYETVSGPLALSGKAIYCGFYLNELIFKLLHRYDAHPALFDGYRQALQRMETDDDEAVLRVFEKHLLSEIGYALLLDHCAGEGKPIDSQVYYQYIIDRGPVVLGKNENATSGIKISGRALIAFREESMVDEEVKKEIKNLTRSVINFHLSGKPLHSRKLFTATPAKQSQTN